jgi:glutathione S-transferase
MRVFILSALITQTAVGFQSTFRQTSRSITKLRSDVYKDSDGNVMTPKKFFVEPSNLLNIAASSAPMAIRIGSGAFVDGYKVDIIKETVENSMKYAVLDGKVLQGYRVEETTTSVFDRRPVEMIELYEFEGCPFCRKVREAVAILDLDVLFYPCPKGSTIYRPRAIELGGKAQFPYMRDSNTGVNIYESDDIIQYMFDTYGPVGSKIPASLTGGALTTIGCSLALLPRMGKGSSKKESKQPSQPLIFWGYESSPFCKVVREKLVELEIPHIQKTCARGSNKRQVFLEEKGIFQVPYIEDPDTGVKLFEVCFLLIFLKVIFIMRELSINLVYFFIFIYYFDLKFWQLCEV